MPVYKNPQPSIILSTDEINAALAEDKTQITIPIEHGKTGAFVVMKNIDDDLTVYHSNDGKSNLLEDGFPHPYLCPYGEVGDVIWVKETHRPMGWSFDDGDVLIQYKDAKSSRREILTEEELESNPNDDYLIAICDELIARGVPMIEGTERFDMEDKKNLPYWRSARDMPKFASRLSLEITEIKFERLNLLAMSDEESKAEGADHFSVNSRRDSERVSFYQGLFSRHWDVKYPNYSCGSNPWVWRIKYKLLQTL